MNVPSAHTGVGPPPGPSPLAAPPVNANTRSASAYCRRLTRASGSNFYYSFLFLPHRRRQAIYAVYAFCRAVDDLVDGQPETRPAAVRQPDSTDAGGAGDSGMPAAGLAAWREEIHRTFSGAPSHPITREIARLRESHGLRREHFLEILRGVEMDLEPVRYERFEDLYPYCYRVAGVVGLLCAQIFGHRDPGTREYAVNLGIGFQLVNILRDLRQDARRGRVYLPLEDLDRYGCSEAELCDGTPGPGFEPLIRFECERARELLRHARRRLPPVDRRAMWPAEAMAGVYEKLLSLIEPEPRRVLSGTLRVPPWRKAAFALRALLGRALPAAG